MALVISSTSDTQEQVDAAAGIEAPVAPAEDAAKPNPKEAPPKPTPEYEPDEEENGEEDGEQPEHKPDEEQPKPKRTGGFQRKIERQARELDYYKLRLQEIEQRSRMGPPQPQEQAPQQQREGPPRQDQFESYEDWIDKLTDYKLELAQRKYAQQEQQRQMAAAQQEKLSGWQQRVGQFRNEAPDFEDALESVDHININPVLQQAIIADALGPKLAYELARKPEEFARIAGLDPLSALTALGEFKASLNGAAKAAAPHNGAKPVSRAPAPIRPVGQGASTSTVPLDQLPLREYMKARERQIRAAKGK